VGVIVWLIAGGFLGSLTGLAIMFFGGDVSGAPLTFSILAISLLAAIALLVNVNRPMVGTRWTGRIRSVNLDQF
jgi:hypothetical protein